jgi:hypothetical protein
LALVAPSALDKLNEITAALRRPMSHQGTKRMKLDLLGALVAWW